MAEIRKVLDGEKLDSDILNEVATIVKKAGYEVRTPEEATETWMFPATVYMKIAVVNRNVDEQYGDFVDGSEPADHMIEVEIAPYLGTKFTLYSEHGFDRDQHEINTMLGNYLETIKVGDTPDEDGHYRFALKWGE